MYTPSFQIIQDIPESAFKCCYNFKCRVFVPQNLDLDCSDLQKEHRSDEMGSIANSFAKLSVVDFVI